MCLSVCVCVCVWEKCYEAFGTANTSYSKDGSTANRELRLECRQHSIRPKTKEESIPTMRLKCDAESHNKMRMSCYFYYIYSFSSCVVFFFLSRSLSLSEFHSIRSFRPRQLYIIVSDCQPSYFPERPYLVRIELAKTTTNVDAVVVYHVKFGNKQL